MGIVMEMESWNGSSRGFLAWNRQKRCIETEYTGTKY